MSVFMFRNTLKVSPKAERIALGVLSEMMSKTKEISTSWSLCLAPLVGLEPTTCGLTVRRSTDWAKEEYLCSRYLFSRPVTRQLSSAYKCLTSVFGMGTGGPTWQSTRTLWRKRCSPSYIVEAYCGFLIFATLQLLDCTKSKSICQPLF